MTDKNVLNLPSKATLVAGDQVVVSDAAGIIVSKSTPEAVTKRCFADAADTRFVIADSTSGCGFKDSAVRETATEVIFDKDAQFPPASIILGPTVRISDSGNLVNFGNDATGEDALVPFTPYTDSGSLSTISIKLETQQSSIIQSDDSVILGASEGPITIADSPGQDGIFVSKYFFRFANIVTGTRLVVRLTNAAGPVIFKSHTDSQFLSGVGVTTKDDGTDTVFDLLDPNSSGVPFRLDDGTAYFFQFESNAGGTPNIRGDASNNPYFGREFQVFNIKRLPTDDEVAVVPNVQIATNTTIDELRQTFELLPIDNTLVVTIDSVANFAQLGDDQSGAFTLINTGSNSVKIVNTDGNFGGTSNDFFFMTPGESRVFRVIKRSGGDSVTPDGSISYSFTLSAAGPINAASPNWFPSLVAGPNFPISGIAEIIGTSNQALQLKANCKVEISAICDMGWVGSEAGNFNDFKSNINDADFNTVEATVAQVDTVGSGTIEKSITVDVFAIPFTTKISDTNIFINGISATDVLRWEVVSTETADIEATNLRVFLRIVLKDS